MTPLFLLIHFCILPVAIVCAGPESGSHIPGIPEPWSQIPGKQNFGPQIPGKQNSGPHILGKRESGPYIPEEQEHGPQISGEQEPGPQLSGEQELGPQIPGKHYPITFGATGNELISTGVVPAFLSYMAKDEKGNERSYVPMYVAVETDAGTSQYKDLRQNSDKVIEIHGTNTFWCAFGHPFRQFAWLDLYKLQIIKGKIKNTDLRPAVPLIRGVLVEANAVIDIMKEATTEPFNKVDGTNKPVNVDRSVATNQFGFTSAESKRRLEKAILPGSLVTFVGDADLNKYEKVVKLWGQIEDVSSLKELFNVPTQTFSPPELSLMLNFFTENGIQKTSIATSAEVLGKLAPDYTDSEWNENYAAVLKKMENYFKTDTNLDQHSMHTLQRYSIQEYLVKGFADSNIVKNLIQKQDINSNYINSVERLLNSFKILKMASGSNKLKWYDIIAFGIEKGPSTKPRINLIQQCVSLMEGYSKTLSADTIIEKLGSGLDDFQIEYPEELDIVKIRDRLSKTISKTTVLEYFKDKLALYIQSDKDKLSNENKNILLQYLNNDQQISRSIDFTDDIATTSKTLMTADNPKHHIILPDDQLSLELVDEDIDLERVRKSVSQIKKTISYISPPKKVIFNFPTNNVDENEKLWKKRAVQIGDYIRDAMYVNKIELNFKTSNPNIIYDMISHTIDVRGVKEIPFRFEEGHPVIDNRIACHEPKDIIDRMVKTFDTHIIGGSKFQQVMKMKITDIVFVRSEKGFFISNSYQENLKDSMTIVDYHTKQLLLPIKNEIIIELSTQNNANSVTTNNNQHISTVTTDASKMLESGYSKKSGKYNIVHIVASKEGDSWKIKSPFTDSYTGPLVDVRITIVGIGEVTPRGSTWKIGGQDSSDINDLITKTKAKLDIKNTDLKRVSIVACNPKSSEETQEDVEKRAIKFAKEIANENNVMASTRTGYVRVDADGHKFYSSDEHVGYHRRHEGDVFIITPNGDRIIKKRAKEILDPDIPKSEHLGLSKTVSNEHESEIFKNGWHLKHELELDHVNDKVNIETKQTTDKTGFFNPKVQRRFQNVGTVMSRYGMIQTTTSLIFAEKCKNTESMTKEECQARKGVTIASLFLDMTEELSNVAAKNIKFMRTKGESNKIKPVKTKFPAKWTTFGKSTVRNAVKGLPMAGGVFDSVSLGLDIYELTRAKTDIEKGIAGIHVALSSLSVIASTTSAIASVLAASSAAASSVAAVAGPVGLVIATVAQVFSFGVSIWSNAQSISDQKQYEKKIRPHVQTVAEWFDNISSVYDQSWYNINESTLYIKSGIHLKNVNLANRYITINSDYLCETKKGEKVKFKLIPDNPLSTAAKVLMPLTSLFGLGFTVAKEVATCKDYKEFNSNCYCNNADCSGLIDIRSGLNKNDLQPISCNDFKTIVLKTQPIAIYNYTFGYFTTKDEITGLLPKDLETGSDNGRRIAQSSSGKFYYDYKFCNNYRYAIMASLGVDKMLPSVTEVELDNDPINIVIPRYDDKLGVSFKLLGVYGAKYSVYLSNSCRVRIQTKPHFYPCNRDITVWKLFIDIELIDLLCTFINDTNLMCRYNSTEIHVVTPDTNTVIFTDNRNISSVVMFQNDKTMLYILEVQASTFTSDKELLEAIDRYLQYDFIEMALKKVPTKNVTIRACGNKVISNAFISVRNDVPILPFTSEYPGSCDETFNTDAELRYVKTGLAYYSSSINSLVWNTHYDYNYLKSFVILPCHSTLRSDIDIFEMENTMYISQILNVTLTIELKIIYKLTDYRLFLLSISSDNDVSWEMMKSVCFNNRKYIFSDKRSFIFDTDRLLSGENDLTLVKTSKNVYWVRKLNDNIAGRIFPNLNATCDTIDISIPDVNESISRAKECSESQTVNNKDQIYYFLCMKDGERLTFIQKGNTQAKYVEDLSFQQIYSNGKDIFVRNNSNTFTVDEGSQSEVCLFEYEMNLPYEDDDSVADLMVNISQQYNCFESKVKLKFEQLVGWFDYNEMVAVIVHKSISKYKLNAIGVTTDLNKYWILDTVNGSLYLQETAYPLEMTRLINGTYTEDEYHANISIPVEVISNVQEVSYENGMVYVYSSTGAEYYVKENGEKEILVVTDFWLKTHPYAQRDLEKETDKEFVLYRPDKGDKPSNIDRCEVSPYVDQFLLYQISFGLFFNIDLEDNVYIGSNRQNNTVFIFNYQSGLLQEVNERGTVIKTDSYNIVHRINGKTLIVETNSDTKSSYPPYIDNIGTLILSTSKSRFQFSITRRYWSQIDEILLSNDTEPLSVYLDMLPCVYDLEQIDDRALLIDYAFGKKLVIPNAEERGKENRLHFYVCGKRIYGASTSHPNHVVLITLMSTFVILMIFIVSVALIRRRRRNSNICSNENEEKVHDEIEMQASNATSSQTDHTDIVEPQEVLSNYETSAQTEQTEEEVVAQTELTEEKVGGLLTALNDETFYINDPDTRAREFNPSISEDGAAKDFQEYTTCTLNHEIAPSSALEKAKNRDDVLEKFNPVTLTTGVSWHTTKIKAVNPDTNQ